VLEHGRAHQEHDQVLHLVWACKAWVRSRCIVVSVSEECRRAVYAGGTAIVTVAQRTSRPGHPCACVATVALSHCRACHPKLPRRPGQPCACVATVALSHCRACHPKLPRRPGQPCACVATVASSYCRVCGDIALPTVVMVSSLFYCSGSSHLTCVRFSFLFDCDDRARPPSSEVSTAPRHWTPTRVGAASSVTTM
jgi:hypothetical protein